MLKLLIKKTGILKDPIIFKFKLSQDQVLIRRYTKLQNKSHSNKYYQLMDMLIMREKILISSTNSRNKISSLKKSHFQKFR